MKNITGTISSGSDTVWMAPEVFNIVDYGAVVNSSGSAAANVTAINAAITDALAVGGTVFFPQGKWYINAAISISSGNNIRFLGAGMSHSILCQLTNATNAITVSQTNRLTCFAIENMRISHEASTALNTGSALYIENTQNAGNLVFTNFLCRNVAILCDAGSAKAFTYGLRLLNMQPAFIDTFVYVGTNAGTGTGISCEGYGGSSNAGEKCINVYVTNASIFYCNIAVRIQHAMEGFHLTNFNFVGVVEGIVADGCIHLGITSGHMNVNDYCIRATGTGGSVMQAQVTGILFYIGFGGTGCVGVSGLFVDSAFTGNTFNCNDTGCTGIAFTGASDGNIISGNTFLANVAFEGVNFGASSTDNRCSNNAVNGTVTWTDSGSSNVMGDTGGMQAVPTLTAATTNNVDVDITALRLGKLPGSATITLSGTHATDNIVGAYDWTSGSSTKTNARFVVWRTDGTNLPAGGRRFNVLVTP